MKLILNIFKITTFSILSVFLFSCSSEADLELQEKRKLKVEAQKKLEAEAKEIRAKAKARSEFVEKNCEDAASLECQKLLREAGFIKGKDLL